MPITVREIGVKVHILDAAPPAAPRALAPAPGVAGLSRREREALVDDCVRRVLAELRRGQER